MPELIVDIGGETSNSYVSLVEADTYMDQRLDAGAWEETAPDDRMRALITAANRLNREVWNGDKASSNQRLAWPRANAPKPDGVGGFAGPDFLGAGASLAYRTGYGFSGFPLGEVFPSNEIPEEIKSAQCELALAYLGGFRESGEQIREHSMDGLSVKKDLERSGAALPIEVQRLINGLVQGYRLERG